MSHLAEPSRTESPRKTGPLRRALSLPTRLVRRFRPTGSDARASTLSSFSTSQLQQQVSLTILTGHPDRKALAQHIKPAIRDLQSHDWDSLGNRLTRLDRRHSALPSGDRIAIALGQALFRHMAGPKACQLIDRGQSLTDEDLPPEFFAPLTRALSKPDTPPAIHFLAAQLNLEAGWARRPNDLSDYADEVALNAAQARFTLARSILDNIAARAPHSAHFAELDYRVRAAEGTTEDELTRAAIRWSRTDPTALSPYTVHGLHLLPRWYGSEGSLDAFADRSWSRTHESLGAAAYAACYLAAIESDPNALLTLDMIAFRDGLIDMMRESDDPDVTCNAILRGLWEVGSEGYGTEGHDTAALRRARKDLRSLFVYLARNTLGPVMPDAWGSHWTEARLLHAIAEAFEPEILSGKQISIGLDGTHIH